MVEKAFEGARLNPTKTTYVRTSTGIFFFGFSTPFVLHCVACTPLCCFDGVRLNPTKTTYVRTCVFSTSPSKEKHGYWTFEYLLSLFLCDSDQVFNHILQEDLCLVQE